MKSTKIVAVLAFFVLWCGVALAETDFDPCGLLADPAAYAAMSSALETHLRLLCNAPAALVPHPSEPAAPAEAIANGPDVLVNDRQQETAAKSTQSECAISVRAADGALVAGWNDSSHYTGLNGSFAGYGAAGDGGASWADGGALPGGGLGSPMGDPCVEVDNNGAFYYSAMVSPNGVALKLLLLKSTDGGATFGEAVIAHNGTADDKVLMAVDRTGGAHDGAIYICAMDFSNYVKPPFCVHSYDGGATFSAKASVCPDCPAGSYQAPYPVVAPDGTVYVAWVGFGAKSQIYVAKSTDGGKTFAKLPNPMPAFAPSQNSAATMQCGRAALKGNIRYMDYPSPVVDKNGWVHILYSKHGAGQDSADVMYVKSEDGGETWSTPVRLNDDQTSNDNFMQALVVNPFGLLFAYWYDRRDGAQNLNYKVYLSRSLDGGDTWLANQALSDAASPPYSGSETAACYMGDYNKGAADENFFYAIWSDNREEIGGHPDPDVYFEAVPVCDNANVDVTFEPPGGTFDASEAPLAVVLAFAGDDPNCPAPGVIRYTLDGSAPTIDSPTYAGPIEIATDAVLRILPTTCCGQAMPEESETYTFTSAGDDDQSPTGDNDDDNGASAGDDDNDDDGGGCGC